MTVRRATIVTRTLEPVRGEMGTVTVTVDRTVPTILLGLVGLHTLTVSAHATATPRGP